MITYTPQKEYLKDAFLLNDDSIKRLKETISVLESRVSDLLFNRVIKATDDAGDEKWVIASQQLLAARVLAQELNISRLMAQIQVIEDYLSKSKEVSRNV